MKEKSTKSKGARKAAPMRAEYNFDYGKAVRGKYYRRLVKEGSNVVVLDPDVAQRFRTSAAVNKALRALLKVKTPARRVAARTLTRGSGKTSGTAR